MSRSKLFNMIKSRGTQPNGRNMFDLSNRHAYSMKAGIIKPIKAIHTIPDDYLDVDVSDFSQTFPMHTAAFMRGRKEIAAYFVPYNSIWHNFNQYMATREDPDSVLLQGQGISKEPKVPLYNVLYRAALDQFMVMALCKYWFPLFAAYRIADYHRAHVLNNPTLDFGDFFVPVSSGVDAEEKLEKLGAVSINDYFLSKFADAELVKLMDSVLCSDVDGWNNLYSPIYYQKGEFGVAASLQRLDADGITNENIQTLYDDDAVFSHSSRFCYYETTNSRVGSALFPRVNTRDIYFDTVGNLAWQGIVDKLDMLGYGNLHPIFGVAIQKMEELGEYFRQGYASHIIDDTINAQLLLDSLHGTAIKYNDILIDLMHRLQSMFNVGTDALERQERFVSPYPLYAYNRVFYDMFRNSYYDLDYNIRNYNCDNINCNYEALGVIVPADLPARFYKLECHQWKKDMFTGVLPDKQFGAVSSVSFSSVSGNDFNRWSVAVSGSFPYGENVTASSSSSAASLRTDSTYLVHTHAFSGSVDVMALRRAECLQQYRMDLLRAGNRTSDIFKQIYGTNPKSELDESPYFIEVMGNDIFVDPVVSTASTGSEVNGSLGDIAARGLISGNNMHFKFSTKDFGVVIFVAYIVPESMYNSYRIDPHLMNLDPESHFIPQFQNLGLEPVFGEWLNNGTPAENVSVRGYAPSYLEFKTDIDLAHGVFSSKAFRALSELQVDDGYIGSLSHWIVARTDMQNSKALTLSNFYVNPRILDSVFLQAADALPDSDQFICYTSIGVKAVRQLSELGLPRFC